MSRAPHPAELLLFEEAQTLTARSYAPYSGLAVGAVVVGPSGRSHYGVNVENASYPAGLCAERAALAAMVASGERVARRIAVAAAGGRDCLPCGMCLQALSEFGDPEIVVRTDGEVCVMLLSDLLTAPFAFGDCARRTPPVGDGGGDAAATAGEAAS